MAYYSKIMSPLGGITLYSRDGAALAGLWMDTQTPRMDAPELCDSLSVFRDASDWLTRYFDGDMPEPDEIPVEFRGTVFQCRVWRELLNIPYGTTVSYGELAKRIGCNSAQAVGQAVGRNPVSILVPCHRVIGADGGLTGYTAGLDKKRALLKLEGIL